MSAVKVSEGQWIRIRNSIDGYVFQVNCDGNLEVGYFQNQLKAIRETVTWRDGEWIFKYSGPNGSYLRGADEELVKRSPRGLPPK